MTNCRGCESVAYCSRFNECPHPVVAQERAKKKEGEKVSTYNKHVVIPHNGKHRIIDLEFTFQGDVLLDVAII